MTMALSEVNGDTKGGSTRILGNLSLDLRSFRLFIQGEYVRLTFTEMELLSIFFREPDAVIPYQSIAESLWGQSSPEVLRHLHVLVHRLRAKLSASHPYVIETVRGRGYGLLKLNGAGALDESEP